MNRTQAIVVAMDGVLIDSEAFQEPAKRISNVQMFPLQAFFRSHIRAVRILINGMTNFELLIRIPRGRSPVG
jgi:hypothetical protein